MRALAKQLPSTHHLKDSRTAMMFAGAFSAHARAAERPRSGLWYAIPNGAKPSRAARVREERRAADAQAMRTAHWSREAAARFVNLLREKRPAARRFALTAVGHKSRSAQ
jgi:hypothetical protein